jgi:hypothetical protein
LRKILAARFDEGELRTLCFDLGIDYDDLPGEGKANKARELVAYLERRGCISELVRIGKQSRPDVSWGDTPGVTKEAPFTSQSLPPEWLLISIGMGVLVTLIQTALAKTPISELGERIKEYLAWVPFKLQIARLVGLEFEVRAFKTPMGEPRATGTLPYDPADLIAVLKTLEFGHYNPDRFTSAQTEALQRLSLLRDARLVPDAVLKSQIAQWWHVVERRGTGLAGGNMRIVHLATFGDAVELARYPWELLHDGHRHLPSGGAVEMARYIAYPEAATALPVAPPWRLLYIAARPRNLDRVSDDTEWLAVWNGLQSLTKTGKLTLDRLGPPTYDALLDRMTAADYHIIHFDGHGVFARRCPECGKMHYSHVTTCQSCATPLDDVPPLGYLAFENSVGDTV